MSQPNEGQDRIDYRETDDITEVHASVAREHAEPRAGTMPIPTWLGVIGAAALCWAGAYIGVFHGGFSGNVYNENTSTPADIFSSQGAQQGAGGAAAELTLAQLGQKVYSNCQACHGADGAGVAAQNAPPLAGSEWVESEKRLVAILLKGVSGPLTVKGKAYGAAMMPAWETSLSAKQLAAVATYLRQSWGNNFSEITEDQIKAAKKEFGTRTAAWSETDLNAIPADAKLPGGGAPAAAAKPADAKPAETAKPADAKPAAPAAGPTFDLASSVASGKAVYMTTCMACHQINGQGLAGTFPPFDGSEWVIGDTKRLVALALKGYEGPITVKGVQYPGVAPLIAVDTQFVQLKDNTKLADVLNYIRNSWSNKATEPVTPDFIQKVRDEFKDRTAPWNAADIEKAFPQAK